MISPQDNDRVSRPPYFNEILADEKRRFKIDEDRIIGTGLSSGGTGIWRWALNNPDVFAGIVPVCAVMQLEEIKQLKDMPVWIFNNEYDKVWIQEIAIANMKGNPNFKYTIFAGAKGYDAWSKAYSVKGLEEWMSKLDRKNNSDNASSVLAQYKTENKLTPPQVKVEKGQNYLTLAFDPTAEHYGKQQKKDVEPNRRLFCFHAKSGYFPIFTRLTVRGGFASALPAPKSDAFAPSFDCASGFTAAEGDLNSL